MKQANIGHWTKTPKGWQMIMVIKRHWEAPDAGTGKGQTIRGKIVKRGEYESRVAVETYRLTSNVFRSDGKLKAFVEPA